MIRIRFQFADSIYRVNKYLKILKLGFDYIKIS